MNALKTLLTLGLILVMMNGCDEPEQTAVDVPIGMAISLTGSFAPYGISQLNGLELAFNELNSGGYIPGIRIFPVLMDDKSSPDTCRRVFTDMISTYKVMAIIGPTSSNNAFTVGPMAQNNKVVMMGISNTVPGITEMGDYIFRNSLTEAAVIPNTVKVTQSKLGYSRVAIVYGNDDTYTIGAYDAFKAALDSIPALTIVTTETISKGDTVFIDQLTRIKAANPDVIILAALVTEAARIMKQARELGISPDVRFIGGNSLNTSRLWEMAGDASNGSICGSAWIHSANTPGNAQFVAVYTSIYGSKPDQFAAQAYTSLYIMADALRRTDPLTSTMLRDELAKTDSLDTVLGRFSFDLNRDPVHSPVVQEMVNGDFLLFQ
jgi:branched-chain amino acid transport system substrate-binding protein